MDNHIDESSTTTKIFRFNSGELLTLNECQIEKIPYLTALVSAGPYFDSIQANEGYYLLDSCIKYQDFLFALDSISFYSIRQVFIRLPKSYNILSIIALLDFLGVGPREGPTLEEVDSSFFWIIECDDSLGTYQLIYRSSDTQDMAVRFAIAMAKEEYDFKNRKIIDQIYWFIMFILSAHKLFQTNIRYHVYKIAENYFSIFCPSLLKSLYQLEQRIEKEIQEKSITTDNHISQDWNPTFLSDEDFPYRNIVLINGKSYFNSFNKYRKKLHFINKNLEPICNKVFNYIYKYLLDTVLEQVSAKTPSQNFDNFDQLTYEVILDEIINRNTVQVTIRKSILSEICELTAKFEQKYSKLTKKIQKFKRNIITLIEHQKQNYSQQQVVRKIGELLLTAKQDEVLTCERTLNELYEYESVLNTIRNKVLDDLHDQLMNEIEKFLLSRRRMWRLRRSISPIKKEEKELFKSKKINTMYTTTKYRPLPKTQCKHTTR